MEQETTGLSPKSIETYKLAIASAALILALVATLFLVKYAEQIKQSPCEYVAEHSNFVCYPNPDYYTNCLRFGSNWKCEIIGINSTYVSPNFNFSALMEDINEGEN